MRGRGFSIIELIIATAIVALLLAVGLPRYNTFLYQQDFNGRTANLAGCIQKAQQDAASPTTTLPRSIGSLQARITVSGTGLTCEVHAYPPDATFTFGESSTSPLSGSSSTVSLPNLVLCNLTANSRVSNSLPQTLIIHFPIVQRGVPAELYWKYGGTVVSEVPQFGQGIETKIGLAEKTVGGSCDGLTATLTMGRLGIPVQIK